MLGVETLDLYRKDLNGIRSLTPAEEQELAAAYVRGEVWAGHKLVESSLPFVIRIAKEYRRWGVPLEDLIQQGNLGLLKAAMKFDPGKDCRLITYAVYWIRAEIREYVIRGYRIVRLGTTRTERKALRSYRKERFESPADLARESGMPLARCEKLWPLIAQGDVALDASSDESGSALDRLASAGPSPEDLAQKEVDSFGLQEAIRMAVGNLSTRERRIVQARLMAEEPCTLEELGREMGVSKERVRQLEERARMSLRGALSEYQNAA